MRGQGYAFSFSGLKTAVHRAREKLSPADLCASFQQAVIDVLVEKTLIAAEEFGVQRISLAGGVAANQPLRLALEQNCRQRGLSFYVPRFEYCTDNGAMIAMAGYQMARLGVTATTGLDAHASLPLQAWRTT